MLMADADFLIAFHLLLAARIAGGVLVFVEHMQHHKINNGEKRQDIRKEISGAIERPSCIFATFSTEISLSINRKHQKSLQRSPSTMNKRRSGSTNGACGAAIISHTRSNGSSTG